MPAPHITVIGAGATGCALLPLLAAMPIAGITIVDGDTVEGANLPRQPLYGPGDTGRLKVDVARERLLRIAPDKAIAAVPSFLDAGNAHALITTATVVCDCTDDLPARLLIDRVCSEHGIPLITGAVHGHQIQVATLHVAPAHGGEAPTLRTFFPGRTAEEQDGCDMQGVPAYVTALAGALMARHAEALLKGDRSLAGTLELIDMRDGRWMRIAAPVPPHDDDLIAQRRHTTIRT